MQAMSSDAYAAYRQGINGGQNNQASFYNPMSDDAQERALAAAEMEQQKPQKDFVYDDYGAPIYTEAAMTRMREESPWMFAEAGGPLVNVPKNAAGEVVKTYGSIEEMAAAKEVDAMNAQRADFRQQLGMSEGGAIDAPNIIDTPNRSNEYAISAPVNTGMGINPNSPAAELQYTDQPYGENLPLQDMYTNSMQQLEKNNWDLRQEKRRAKTAAGNTEFMAALDRMIRGSNTYSDFGKNWGKT